MQDDGRLARLELDGAEETIEKEVDVEGEGNPDDDVEEEDGVVIEAEKFVERRATGGELDLGEDEQEGEQKKTNEMNNAQSTGEIDHWFDRLSRARFSFFFSRFH